MIALTGCSRKPADHAAAGLEEAFEHMMNGATLVGHSTFQTRMRLYGHDFPVPVPVTIKWAGDTPVITLTDVSIPGFGTYTARVVLCRDQYAGTWSGKKAGGQIFGKIPH